MTASPTFEHRRTALPDAIPFGLSDEFAQDRLKQTQWQAFLRKNALDESTARDGRKDVFSAVRAQRIDWIKATLKHPTAALFEGWDKTSRQYDATRRVAVVYENFVVVVAMGLKQDGSLKVKLVTCYQADNSIRKIRSSPTAMTITMKARFHADY